MLKKHQNLVFIIECSIFTALAVVLDLLTELLGKFLWINGGAISLSMIPIVLMGYKWGPKGSLTVGFLTGIIACFLPSAYILGVGQAMLDYVFAYGLVGLCGIFFLKIKEKKYFTQVGMLAVGLAVGLTLRLACATLSGYIYWQTEFWPSLVYNLSYIGPTYVVVLIISALLIKALKGYLSL